MGDPKSHLPPILTDDTINSLLRTLDLPQPSAIRPLQVTAEFHGIYILEFSSEVASQLRPAANRDDESTISLVLRVSGDHIARAKTLNEVGVMHWVRQHTSVPVPAVVRFDATCDNPLGREFTLLERVPGKSVDAMYDELSDEVKMKLVRQLTDIVLELNAHEWNHIGGLRPGKNGNVEPGPLLEDTFWMEQDIIKFWSSAESVVTLNPMATHASHADLVQAYLSCYCHAIKTHPSLTWLRDLTPRLLYLCNRLPSMTSLGSTKLVLAHKDLHFCNVMATPEGDVTGIIDWEFAGVVPAVRWDPVRAFLWSGKNTSEAGEEKVRLRGKFEAELERRGVERWWEADGDVQNVWTVLNYTRALVEVCPRGQRKDMVAGWRAEVEATLDRLEC